jgi:hypothetical protein
MTTTIIIEGLPKISLNEWYAGTHWSERKRIKDVYKLIIRSRHIEPFTEPCDVEYLFEFQSKPLDCSNCVAMLKMIEDCLFPKDGIKVVRSIKLISRKGMKDKVTIQIT